MIRKILGRLAAVRPLAFAFFALASFAASAFDTPYLTFRSASSFNITVYSAKWDGTVDHLFATIGFDGGALVGSLVNEAQMQDCAYLYGQATLTPDTGERVIEVQKLVSLEAFYEVTLYADLDAEIWSIDGASIPSLK